LYHHRELCNSRESLAPIFEFNENYGLIHFPKLADPDSAGYYKEGYFLVSEPNAFQKERGISKVIVYQSPGVQGNRNDSIDDNAFPLPAIQDEANSQLYGHWETWIPKQLKAGTTTSPQQMIENHRARMEAMISRARNLSGSPKSSSPGNGSTLSGRSTGRLFGAAETEIDLTQSSSSDLSLSSPVASLTSAAARGAYTASSSSSKRAKILTETANDK